MPPSQNTSGQVKQQLILFLVRLKTLLGMQHLVIGPEAWGLGLDEITIATRLKSQGYATRMVGKVRSGGRHCRNWQK